MRTWLIVFIVAISTLPAHSQKTTTTIALQLTFPEGEYKDNYPTTGVGIRWNIMHHFKEESPISIGGEFGYLVTASSTKYFDLLYGGFYDNYRVAASNNVLTLAFKARADLIPHPDKMQLFVEATVGTNLFFSSVDITRETYYAGSQYAGGSTSKGYWSFIFGPGLGVEIPLGQKKEIALSFKGSYLFGSNSKYLTDPYIDNGGNVYFTQHESKTDMIVAEAGVRFYIFRNANRR